MTEPRVDYVQQVHSRPDDPSCRVCGAQMVPSGYKCLSCGKVEAGDRALETARKIINLLSIDEPIANYKTLFAAEIQSAMNAQERELREALQKLMGKLRIILPKVDSIIAGRYEGPDCGEELKEAERLLNANQVGRVNS